MQDITTKLDSVHGGAGAGGRAVMSGLKTAVKKGGEWLNNLGGWAGGAAAIKEGWDWMRGNNNSGGNQQPAPAPAPSGE